MPMESTLFGRESVGLPEWAMTYPRITSMRTHSDATEVTQSRKGARLRFTRLGVSCFLNGI